MDSRYIGLIIYKKEKRYIKTIISRVQKMDYDFCGDTEKKIGPIRKFRLTEIQKG